MASKIRDKKTSSLKEKIAEYLAKGIKELVLHLQISGSV